MTDLLLQTKLFIPPVQRNLVARPHLTEKLTRGLGLKLTLISAPAGFGKSTLVVCWRDSMPACLPMAWIALDESDNDPGRFWLYVLSALQTLPGSPGADALAMLRAAQGPVSPAVLTLLVNDLAALREQVVLVLDDYHAIHAPAIHEGVAFVLENLPPQVHLVVTTRSDPPLPLSRLRVRGQINEVRASDLRFRADEAHAFFACAAGVSLTREQSDLLSLRTEGWVAGLKLAGLSMQGLPDVTGFIEAFAGSHRHIADYLVEEVLQRQSEDVITFLVKTSVLERLNGSLCNALTGRTDGSAMLSHLERANLFLIPLDQERRWYRYHHLFRDLLRMRLQHESAAQWAEIHLRASAWFEEHAMHDEAIRHALSGGHAEQAASILERVATHLLDDRAEYGTLLNWMRALPPALVRTKPFICTSSAIALMVTGCWEEGHQKISDAESLLPTLPPEVAERVSAEVMKGKVLSAFLEGDVALTTRLVDEGLAQLSTDNAAGRAFFVHYKALLLRASGQVRDCIPVFDEAIALNEAVGNIHMVQYGFANLAMSYVTAGQLHKASETLAQLLRMMGHSPLADIALSVLGQVQCEQNDLETAGATLHRALALAAKSGRPDPLRSAYMGLARLSVSLGDRQGALSAADRVLEIAKAQRTEHHIRLAQAFRAQVALDCGDLDAAAAWAQDYAPSLGSDSHAKTELANLTLARVWIALGRFEQALSWLATLAATAKAAGRQGSLIEALMLQALACEALGKQSAATESLSRALILAEPEGYVRLFADGGQPLARILARIPSAYAARLLQVMGAAPSKAGTVATQGLVEPLTDREREVLILLAEGCSNQEIARRLILAEGTVKKHTHNIFEKLGVGSRTQALVRGKELGLL